MRPCSAIIGLTLLWASPFSAHAQEYEQDFNEEKVDQSQVPRAALKTASAAAPMAKFATFFQTNDRFFRLVAKDKKGPLFIVLTSEDGDLLSSTKREVVAADKVPAPVTKGFESQKKRDPNLKGLRVARIERVEVTTPLKEGAKRLYEYDGTTPQEGRVRVGIFDDGKFDKVEVVLLHPDALKKDIDASKLPREVKEAALAAVPGGKFTRITHRPGADGTGTYDIRGKDGNGREILLDVGENGVAYSLRTTIPTREFPEEAAEAIKAYAMEDRSLTGFRPSKAQHVEIFQAPGGPTSSFAYLGKNGKGEPIEVRINAESGEIMTMAADRDDLAPARAGATGATKADTSKVEKAARKSRPK